MIIVVLQDRRSARLHCYKLNLAHMCIETFVALAAAVVIVQYIVRVANWCFADVDAVIRNAVDRVAQEALQCEKLGIGESERQRTHIVLMVVVVVVVLLVIAVVTAGKLVDQVSCQIRRLKLQAYTNADNTWHIDARPRMWITAEHANISDVRGV